ncbi:MAG TPA: hypothetical protein VK814_00265 [Acidobacteriaceae bacterium]|jgi:hypothetical protein|nr:hypothetical protein [Acidobacteriaceae bacterium]
MDETHSVKASASRWITDAMIVVGASALWMWIAFDLCSGREKLNFRDGLWLFLGPMLIWRNLPRFVESWNSRRNDA